MEEHHPRMTLPTAIIFAWWNLADQAGVPINKERYEGLRKRFAMTQGLDGQWSYGLSNESGKNAKPHYGSTGRVAMCALAHFVGERGKEYQKVANLALECFRNLFNLLWFVANNNLPFV